MAHDAAAAAAAPVELKTGAGQTAPWLQPGRDEPIVRRSELAAVGYGNAVVQWLIDTPKYQQTIYVAVDARGGVRGPLHLPEGVDWLGLDGSGRLFAVTRGGELWSARSLEAALAPDGLQRVPGNYRDWGPWDANSKWLVAGGPDQRTVNVSINGGRSFRTMKLPENDETVETLAVRHDGTIVLQTHLDGSHTSLISSTLLSKNGSRFRKASYAPHYLARVAGLIAEDPRMEAGSCQAALAGSDAWVLVPAADANRYRQAWLEPVTYSSPGGAMPATLPSPRQPFPPLDPARQVRGERQSCPDGDARRPAETSDGGAAPFQGSIGPAASSNRILALFHDGAGDRPPHLFSVDPSTRGLTMVEPPAGCTPLRAEAIRGLELLLCAEPGGAEIFTRVGDAPWRSEGELEGDPKRLARARSSVAGDGAILLAPDCAGGCGVRVRLPLASGAEDAWRRVAIPGAIGHRHAGGGAVVAITAHPSAGPTHAGFVLARADGSTEILAANVDVGFPIHDVEVDTGRIVLVLQGADGFVRRYLATGGSLLAAD